jgi:hypothetical protein
MLTLEINYSQLHVSYGASCAVAALTVYARPRKTSGACPGAGNRY